MLRTIISIQCIAMILATALTVVCQKTPEKTNDDVIRVDTQLVDVPVTVTGTDGRPLRDLKKANFVIYEDGKPQSIESFATTSAPFEVALLLDTSGSTRSDLQLIKRAATDFVMSLRPGDRVAVSAFGTNRSAGRVEAYNEILTPLTSDREKLRAAIDRASTSSGTPYYDALLDVAKRIFSEPPAEGFRGRRAVVALTDGVDSTSVAEFDEAQEALAAAGVITYFIQVDTREFFESGLLGDCSGATKFSVAQIRRYYRGMSSKSRTGMTTDFCQLGDFERLAVSKRLYEIADEEMNTLARTSGGKLFPAADLTESRKAFKSVADEIGTQFTIGYSPTNEKRDGSFRKIRVELKGLPAGAKARYREGYTARAN